MNKSLKEKLCNISDEICASTSYLCGLKGCFC